MVAPAAAADGYPVEFKFENRQKSNQMKGVVHRMAGWVYVPANDSRSIEKAFGAGLGDEEYYYDANITENKDGGEVYCSFHIKIRQRLAARGFVTTCDVISASAATLRPCAGQTAHNSYVGACQFFFVVGDPGTAID